MSYRAIASEASRWLIYLTGAANRACMRELPVIERRTVREFHIIRASGSYHLPCVIRFAPTFISVWLAAILRC